MNRNTSLYLFPLPPLEPPPPAEAVEQVLRDCGLLGRPLEPWCFLAGEAFFQHITFAGCSPHLKLMPADASDRSFTHLCFHREASPRLRVALQRGRPRCPACRGAVANWKANLHRWREDAGEGFACPACGHVCAVAELDWRQYGVAARLLVEVTRVWPGEAMPGDRLMAALEAATKRRWSHAWAECY
jgi:Zn ribbon nucleic-acid-binding protein